MSDNNFNEFINTNDNEFLELYGKQLLSNLDELRKREQKYTNFLALLLLTFFLLETSKIKSFDIGPMTISDIGIIYVFIPIIFIYTMFNMYSTTFQIQETESVLNQLYGKNLLLDFSNKLNSNKFSRSFLPISFANTAKKMTSCKHNIIESFIGFFLLLPIPFIALLPYGVLSLMLYEVYANEFSNWYGKVSFWSSLWGIFLMIFYVFSNREREND